jgi:hypothetical protein
MNTAPTPATTIATSPRDPRAATQRTGNSTSAATPEPERPIASWSTACRTFTGPRVTFSSTDLCANRLKLWNTIPMSERS